MRSPVLTNLLIRIGWLDVLQGWDAAEQGTSSSRNDSLFHSSSSGIQRISDTVFLLIYFNVTCSTNLTKRIVIINQDDGR